MVKRLFFYFVITNASFNTTGLNHFSIKANQQCEQRGTDSTLELQSGGSQSTSPMVAKTILLTGATDGIGLEVAKLVAARGHNILMHGRNRSKLERAKQAVSEVSGCGCIEGYVADMSRLSGVEAFGKAVSENHSSIDVLINNAGVFRTANTVTQNGMDVRFVVNTIAPYLLTKRLLPLIGKKGRVINVSSAAQSPVDPEALSGRKAGLRDFDAYAQSKLAITMWSRHLALVLKNGPTVIAVNPGSMLGTKMVREGFGSAGGDVGIGADILTRAALDQEFATASGRYFDNDSGRFASPHPHALDERRCSTVVNLMEEILSNL